MVRWMTSFQGDASISIRRTGGEINGEREYCELFVGVDARNMNVCIYVRKCCEIFSNLVSILNFVSRPVYVAFDD